MKPVRGAVIAGKYQLRQQLGEGAMGSVWLATAATAQGAHGSALPSEVAIKLLSPEFAASPEMRARFEFEARAPQVVKSPHVVQILDHGVDGEVPYIVMEVLHGEDLAARLRREHRLSIDAASSLFTQICAGLHAAHQEGIVHRDLKPANIFLVRLPAGGDIVKLVDFGIAKAKRAGAEIEATKTGSFLGTFNYMSPEQAKNSKDVDHRSDLWSLSIVLLRALTGKVPFPGQEFGDLVLKICAGPIPLPSTLAPELGLGLLWDDFFRIALERDRRERFQTALEMAVAFDRVLHGLPPMGERERTVSFTEHEGTTHRLPSSRSLPVIDEQLGDSGTMPVRTASISAQGTLDGIAQPPSVPSGASRLHTSGDASIQVNGAQPVLRRPVILVALGAGLVGLGVLMSVAVLRGTRAGDAAPITSERAGREALPSTMAINTARQGTAVVAPTASSAPGGAVAPAAPSTSSAAGAAPQPRTTGAQPTAIPKPPPARPTATAKKVWDRYN